jgi:hypothetical protein
MNLEREPFLTVGFLHGQSAYEPESRSRWTTWGTVSSGFREIEIGWDRLESVGHVAPFVAPAAFLWTRQRQDRISIFAELC